MRSDHGSAAFEDVEVEHPKSARALKSRQNVRVTIVLLEKGTP
jgi:hypothetical protein